MNEKNELKLLLDMYKGLNKEKRDKAQLMLVEKKLRAELEDLKQQMRRLQVGFIFIQLVAEILGKKIETFNCPRTFTAFFV